MDKGVTSLQKELGCEVPMEEVAGRLQNELSDFCSYTVYVALYIWGGGIKSPIVLSCCQL